MVRPAVEVVGGTALRKALKEVGGDAVTEMKAAHMAAANIVKDLKWGRA